MEINEKNKLFLETKDYVKDMVPEINAENFKKGEMKDLFEDLLLAKAMEEVEQEESLSYEQALKQIKWI